MRCLFALMFLLPSATYTEQESSTSRAPTAPVAQVKREVYCKHPRPKTAAMVSVHLVIAEVDEEIPAIRRDRVTLIDDRREGDGDRLQLSNFSLLENREDHSLEIYLTRLGEDPKDFWGANAYKYTLLLR